MMNDHKTTDKKLKSAEEANSGLLLLIVAIVVGFVTNATFGMVVFVGGMLIAYFLKQQKDERLRAVSEQLTLFSMGATLALRRIYFEATDNEIRSQVKQVAMTSVGGWALLRLELSNDEFKNECERQGNGALYDQAIRKIESDGPPMVLEEKKIVGMQRGW